MFLKHILNANTSLFDKLKLFSMVKKWSLDSSVSLSIHTPSAFHGQFPQLPVTLARPTHWPDQITASSLVLPFLCLWAIAYAVPHPILSTHLWTYSGSFEVQVRLLSPWSLPDFSVGNNIYFFNSQSCLFVQQGMTERVCVGLSICSRQIWWISFIAVSQVLRQEPSTWQVLSGWTSESWCVLT